MRGAECLGNLNRGFPGIHRGYSPMPAGQPSHTQVLWAKTFRGLGQMLNTLWGWGSFQVTEQLQTQCRVPMDPFSFLLKHLLITAAGSSQPITLTPTLVTKPWVQFSFSTSALCLGSLPGPHCGYLSPLFLCAGQSRRFSWFSFL